MEILINWDIQLLYWIHEHGSNSMFDAIAPVLRNKYVWLPLYIGIITYVLTRYPMWKSSYFLLIIIGAVAITDVASGQLLKKYVQRTRPCAELIHQDKIETKVRCSYSYSFPSAHATNHFGLAVILTFLFGGRWKYLKYLLYGWAVLISLSQVYVGVHYPLDVIGGAILGVLLIRLYIRLLRHSMPPDLRLIGDESHLMG